MVTAEDVRSHNSRASCWVVISGQVYDVTDFLDSHPGGANSILRYAGKDATEEYEPIHPAGTIEKHLSRDKHLGLVTGNQSVLQQQSQQQETGAEQKAISTLQNLDEFEVEAKRYLSKKAWIYYSSAADSETSHKNNVRDWDRIKLRPRVLRKVARVSTERDIMGHKSSLPFFIAPAAQAKLGHEDGELCLARGAARYNIPYCTSTYSSVAHEDIAECLEAEKNGGALFFQLYVPIVKENARKLIAEARRLKFKALVVTVDSAVIGKREDDDRYKAELDLAAGVETPRTTTADFTDEKQAPVLRGAHSSMLDWEDLSWIQQEWNAASCVERGVGSIANGPIVLKGIQSVEDALLAAEAGVQGIYLSNHGGRQLDHAPSSIVTLLEIRKFAPQLFDQLEIYVDGGLRRGTDVIKAIALGARGVGVGRPFMYSLSGYGTDGVCKAIQILSDELETSMRLMGVTDLSQLNEFSINTSALEVELPRRVNAQKSISSKL